MTHTTQVFNGALFVTHPFTPNAFIRVDVLQKRFADIVSECSLKALTLSAYPPTTQLIRLRLLFNQVRSLRFPHDEIFKREAERLGTPLMTRHTSSSKLLPPLNYKGTTWESPFKPTGFDSPTPHPKAQPSGEVQTQDIEFRIGPLSLTVPLGARV